MFRLTVAISLLLASAPALADVSGGCACSGLPLTGVAFALPILAFGALLARRAGS